VGRDNELRQLTGLLDRKSTAIAVIYGRRRIGKSLLIEQALRGRPALVFEGLENQPKKEQLAAFLFQLARQSAGKTAGTSARSWRDALIQMEPVLRKRPACIVLDEFQWMANYRRDLVSNLKMIWEQYLSKIPGVKLILCGSIASFMTTKVVRSSALYGRTDLEIHLKGFDLGEARQLLRGKGLDEVIEGYLYVGGVPKYLDLIRDFASVRTAMEELAFRANGYFVEEYNRVFCSHFGRNPDFEKIISALVKHPGGLLRGDLAQRGGVAPGGTLSEHLADLESAGFISSSVPFDKGAKSRLIKYRLSDHYLGFYSSFIKPNLQKIAAASRRQFLPWLAQSGRFHAWRGKAFEQLCFAHAPRIAEILGFSGIDWSAGPYFRAPSRDRSGLQVDLLFSRGDNVLTLCEMKCSAAPIGRSVVGEVERKVQLLQHCFPTKTIQRVLVVHGRPSRELARSGYFYRIIQSSELG
jgi:AAA+ ATPase superfamily predicted ATPase